MTSNPFFLYPRVKTELQLKISDNAVTISDNSCLVGFRAKNVVLLLLFAVCFIKSYVIVYLKSDFIRYIMNKLFKE